MERNGPYQTQMTWKIPCFSIADDFKSRSSSLKAKYPLHRNIIYSIREICLVFKALKQNSPFQARMTWFILRSSPLFRLNGAYAEKNGCGLRKMWLVFKIMKQKRLLSRINHLKHTVFLDSLSEIAFCTGMCSIHRICLFRHALKRG